MHHTDLNGAVTMHPIQGNSCIKQKEKMKRRRNNTTLKNRGKWVEGWLFQENKGNEDIFFPSNSLNF